MPKKKPIAKRLDKLFDDIKNVEPNTESRPRPQKDSAEEKARPAPEVKPLVKRARAGETKPAGITQTDTAISLAFEAGQNSWATLHVMDETNERKWRTTISCWLNRL